MAERFLVESADSGGSSSLVLGLLGGSPFWRLLWFDELELVLELELLLELFGFELELEFEPLLELFKLEFELELELELELFELELELELELSPGKLELELDLELLLPPANLESSFILGTIRVPFQWAGQFPTVPYFESGLGAKSSSSTASHGVVFRRLGSAAPATSNSFSPNGMHAAKILR